MSETLMAFDEFVRQLGPREGDYNVFCDGRIMRLSEMRALVAADLAQWRELDGLGPVTIVEEVAKRQEALKEYKRAEYKRAFQKKFDRWQAANEEAPKYAYRAERAFRRQQEDRQAEERILARIWQWHRGQAQMEEACLDRLSDHDFIALKFAVASRPSQRWLAPL